MGVIFSLLDKRFLGKGKWRHLETQVNPSALEAYSRKWMNGKTHQFLRNSPGIWDGLCRNKNKVLGEREDNYEGPDKGSDGVNFLFPTNLLIYAFSLKLTNFSLFLLIFLYLIIDYFCKNPYR